REGLVAHGLSGLGEERARVRGLERRIRVLLRARSLEGIAARDDLAVQVARLARDAVEILEAVEVRLEFGVADAPVLHRAFLGHLLRAVARERLRSCLEVPGQEAPGEPAPVHRRAAHAFAR